MTGASAVAWLLLTTGVVGPREGNSTVLLFEDFDSYADHEAFALIWQDTSHSEHTLDTTFGNPCQSLWMPSANGNYKGRYIRDLGGSILPSDSDPLVLEFDLFLPPSGGPNWQGARQSCEMRGYSGGKLGEGDLLSLVSMGLYNTSSAPYSAQRYQGRVWTPEYPGPEAWHTLGNGPHDPVRRWGWHRLRVEVAPDQVRFRVDGSLAETVARSSNHPFDTVLLGSDLTSNGLSFYVDNVLVTGTPPLVCSNPRVDVAGGGPAGDEPDNAVDLQDFGMYQRCFTGPEVTLSTADLALCRCLDIDGDRSVDDADFAVLLNCWTGPAPAEGALDGSCDDTFERPSALP